MEATTMPSQSHQSVGVNPRPKPVPVDAELASELSARRDQAGAEALWHEEQAARFRSVERACTAGLEQIDGPQPEVPTQVRY